MAAVVFDDKIRSKRFAAAARKPVHSRLDVFGQNLGRVVDDRLGVLHFGFADVHHCANDSCVVFPAIGRERGIVYQKCADTQPLARDKRYRRVYW